ncbi:hypothetical protein [Allorhizocola rhizosphaerae]|uniref:hypothetical protein n=1 Tax=Allorhizocola rhizosphaerae TaxID=1872709 RepID=UPI0013C2CD28|nr:hypothetical protein [Allorhizocola rhizosphaerae]
MRLQVVRRGLIVLLMAVVAVGAPVRPDAARAADVVPPNRGFENELSGWTRFSAAGTVTATTEQAYEGVKSAKLVDTSAETSTGLESGRLATGPGRHAVVARVLVASGSAQLYLRFYNSAGTLVGNHYSSLGTTGGAWETLSVSGTAPTGTTTFSALIYSAVGNIGTSYFDDVSLSKGVTNLGVQITHSMINGTTFGIGANQNKIFGVFTGSNAGNPPRFATIDADTERVVGATIPLANGATGAWAATTATDGTVYVGTYSNAGVYRHVPGSGTVTSLGTPITGQSFVWCLTAGADGRVYGGTYKSAGYFKYQPANGFATIGSVPIWPGRQYVRSIAFDPSEGATYLGVGTNAALIRFDRVTGAKHNVLPAKYAGESMVGGLTFTGGRLFATMASGTLSVLNIVENADGTVTSTEEATGRTGLHVSPARDGKVYLISGGALHVYDIAARTFTPVGVGVNVAPTELGWVRLADQAAFPGETLVAVGHILGQTHLFKYNPLSGMARTAPVAGAPVTPTDLHSVGAGPDGKIYTGGYLTGGTGVYQPLHGDANDATPDLLHRGMSQTDSILGYGGKVYFGVYPGARVYEYDPAAPWGNSNPRLMAALSGHGQDRPFTLAAGEGKLFVGTVPKYGAYDGALSIFDLVTGELTVKRDLVADQGVVSLAYHGGKVYGGTTIRGGLGVDTAPRAIEAKFFSYDLATAAKVEYSLTLPGGRKPTAITALSVVDGRIWGLAEGFLFVFNPATSSFSTAPVQKFGAVDYRPNGTWRDAAMTTTPKDTTSVYVTIAGALYRINKSTLAVTHLAAGAHGITVDQLGDIYYYNDTNLFRYLP